MADLPIKALSIRQPWAWAIVHAGKDIENRDWPTLYRGPVCIHAAKGLTSREWTDAAMFMIRQFNINTPDPKANSPLDEEMLDRGGIIGVAEIVDCVITSESPWFFGRYGFVLKNARPVGFIPVKGALGFFDWRARVIGGVA
jgi:hypothetical protein